MFDPERDADLVIRFAQDVGVAIMAYLALALWPLGEVDRARKIADETVARARRGDRETGVADLRQALAAHTETGNKLHVPYFQGLLAELEAEAEGADGALARIDAALAVAAETGERWTDAFLHRIRGEILWKRDPADTAPTEEAFLTAIAVAQQQKARSFELRAALALAKLYQSINRAADAYAVVAPALEGFSPTPEFPEIAEAQTLLAALAATDEVKNAKVSRR